MNFFELLQWFAEYPYIELSNFQSIVSVFIAINIASPLFMGVLKKTFNSLELKEKKSRETYDELNRDFEKNVQPIMKTLKINYEIYLEVNKNLKESFLRKEKNIKNGQILVENLENGLALLFPDFIKYGAMQLLFLFFITIIEVKITLFIAVGITILLIGTTWDCLYNVFQYTHVVNKNIKLIENNKNIDLNLTNLTKMMDEIKEQIELMKYKIKEIKIRK